MNDLTKAGPDLTGAVARTIADLLGTSLGEVTSTSSLFDLPGFDSVCVVSTLERLEDELGVEVPPDAIVPEAFETLDSLATLVSRGTTKGNAE